MSKSDKEVSANMDQVLDQISQSNQVINQIPQQCKNDQNQEFKIQQYDFDHQCASADRLGSQAEEKILIYKQKLLFLKHAIDRLESHASNCNNQANHLQEVLDQQKEFVEEPDIDRMEKKQQDQKGYEDEIKLPQYFDDLKNLQRVQEEIDGVKTQQQKLLQEGQDVKQDIETALTLCRRRDNNQNSNSNQVDEDEEYKISMKLQEMNAKHQATKSKLRHHQQCLDQLSKLLSTTRQLLNAYPLKVQKAMDFDVLFERKVFISDRFLRLQKVLIQLGYLYNTGSAIQEDTQQTRNLQEKSNLQQILQKLQETNTTEWFNNYKRVSEQLKALDLIREGHLNDQKKRQNKPRSFMIPDLNSDENQEISVGSRPQRLAGYNSMQILTGSVLQQQQAKVNEDENINFKLSQVAGGYSDEELALGVDIDNEQEDGPYIQITDFFTSLTTVKYILDCSDACEDLFMREIEFREDNKRGKIREAVAEDYDAKIQLINNNPEQNSQNNLDNEMSNEPIAACITSDVNEKQKFD